MISYYDLKNILRGKNSAAMPVDDFRIIDSYAVYKEDNDKKVSEKPLDYLCYEIESINPETGEKLHFYKALKFVRIIRLPKSAKQSTSFMDIQQQILTSVYEQGYNMVTIIANIIKPKPIGLLYLYGVQGVADNIADAKKQADHDYIGLTRALQGSFRVLEMKNINAEETEWLREKMYNMEYMTVVRGVPKANKGGEDMGNKGIGGKNLNPDSQGTLEEFIAGMADYEYVLQILSTPVFRRTLQEWSLQTEKQMTAWNSQLQGTKALSFNISMPMMYMANSSNSQGWNKAYTDAESVSYSEGQSFSNSFSESVGQGLSKTFSESHGISTGQSITNSVSNSVGTTQGTTVGQTIGQSFGQSIGQSTSQSFGQSTNQSFGQSTNETFGESTSSSFGQSTSQNFGQSSSNSQSFGQSSSTSQSVGSSQNVSQGQSTNQSVSQNSSQSQGFSQGQSFNKGFGSSVSESHNVGTSQSTGTSQSESTTQGTSSSFGTSSSSSQSNSVSNGWSSSESHGASNTQTGSSSVGNTTSSGFSTNIGASHTTGSNQSSSTNESLGGGFLGVNASGGKGTSTGTSTSDSTSMSFGSNSSQSNSFTNSSSTSSGVTDSTSFGSNGSTSMGSSVSQGTSQSQGFSSSNSNTIGNSQSFGTSESYGTGSSQSTNESFGVSQNTSQSTSVSNGSSSGWGSSISQSQGTSSSFGTSSGQNMSNSLSNGTSQSVGSGTSQSVGSGTSQSVGSGTSQSVGTGTSQSTGTGTSSSTSNSQSISNSTSNSQSISNSTSTGQSVGSSMSESNSQSVSNGTSESHSQSTGVSQGTSTSSGTSKSQSISTGMSGATATGSSSSMGFGPSVGYNKSYQWMDQQVKDILELLEFQNERIKKALRGEGAFYSYVYIACPSRDALAAASAVAKATWQNEYAMVNPLQVLKLTEEEQKHLLYHFAAFSADVTRENVGGAMQYKYSTVLLPQEYVAYTHLPRISEGGVFADVNDIPKFAVPSGLKGEIYMGTILSAERFTLLNGYRTPFDYRIDESELMHGFFTGASRSGKTVAAMRFVAELANVRRKNTGKRLRVVCMDPKQDWRTLARFVDADRFRFYSLGNCNFHPVKINPFKIPRGVVPQTWIDGVIDIYCRAYGLLERGKQMMGETIYALYEDAGVFAAQDHEDWEDIVPELSKQVTFTAVYKKMESIKARLEDPTNPKGRAGNDTRDAYARLLDRLQCFSRSFSIETKLFGTSEGIAVDEMIGNDDVTILESSGLEKTFKNFIFGVITSGFYKFAKAHEGGYLADDQYETVLVIEEANEVLIGNDCAGSGSGSSSGMTVSGQSEFEEILDQSAGYGLFIIAITQKIADMPKSIIANSGLVFAGRLKTQDDITVVIRSIAREEKYDDRDLVKWFPRMATGMFVCQRSRTFDFKDAEPILVQIARLNAVPPSNMELEEIISNQAARRALGLA